MQSLVTELANTSKLLQSTFVALHEAETTAADAVETARRAQEQMSLMHAVMVGWHAMDSMEEGKFEEPAGGDCYHP
jgi:hypothetical protein